MLDSRNINTHTQHTHTHTHTYIYMHIYIHSVAGGMCQTSGECSLLRSYDRLKLGMEGNDYTDITQNTYVYPKLNGYGDNGQRSLKL